AFPWWTWATMATLRRSVRSAAGRVGTLIRVLSSCGEEAPPVALSTRCRAEGRSGSGRHGRQRAILPPHRAIRGDADHNGCRVLRHRGAAEVPGQTPVPGPRWVSI